MSFHFLRKIITLTILLAVLGACAAPPAAAPGETGSTAVVSGPTEQSPPQPSPTLPAAPTQAQSSDCSQIALGESLPFVNYDGGYQLGAIDPQNGLPACGSQAFSFRDFIQYTVSPDQKALAISDEGQGANPDVRLHLIDLETLQEIPANIAPDGWVSSLVFNPDGTRLALLLLPDSGQAKGDNLEVIDVNSREVVKRQALAFSPSLAQYTPDGSQLVLFGGGESSQADATPVAHLLVLNATDYSIAWETQLAQIPDGMRLPAESSSDPILDQWGPAAALSQDGRSLFILHADGASLTTVDLENRQVATQDVSRKVSWLESLLGLGAQTAYAKGFNGTTRQGVLSATGLFYVVGKTDTSEKNKDGTWNFATTPLGLQVIDVRNGEIVGQLGTQATQEELSADGSRLYLQGWKGMQPWTEVVATDGLQVIRRLENTYLAPARRLDGQSVLMASQVTAQNQVNLGAVSRQALESGKPWPTWTSNNSWLRRSDPPWLSP